MSTTAKRKFMMDTSALFVACHHAQPDTDKAIDYAEALWLKLCSRGYGPTQGKTKERVGINYYEKLSQYQQKWFCLFWTNFKYLHGKQRAAKSWAKLGELNDVQYKAICDAATAESHRALPQGQTRAMAELWLNERRFEDNAATSKSRSKQDTKKAADIQEASQSLQHFTNMKQQSTDSEIQDMAQVQIDKYQNLLNELRN